MKTLGASVLGAIWGWVFNCFPASRSFSANRKRLFSCFKASILSFNHLCICWDFDANWSLLQKKLHFWNFRKTLKHSWKFWQNFKRFFLRFNKTLKASIKSNRFNIENLLQKSFLVSTSSSPWTYTLLLTRKIAVSRRSLLTILSLALNLRSLFSPFAFIATLHDICENCRLLIGFQTQTAFPVPITCFSRRVCMPGSVFGS